MNENVGRRLPNLTPGIRRYLGKRIRPTAEYEYTDAKGDRAVAMGYTFIVDGREVDFFPEVVLKRVMHWAPRGNDHLRRLELVGFPRPLFNVPVPTMGHSSKTARWYTRNQISLIANLYRRFRWNHTSLKSRKGPNRKLFIAMTRRLFYVVDAPEHMHNELVEASRIWAHQEKPRSKATEPTNGSNGS